MRNPLRSRSLIPRFTSTWIVAALLAAHSGAQQQPAADAEATAAQPTRIFVAARGKDSNPGTRAAPKRTLQAAHNAITANGEIVVVDTATYGPLHISKSLSVLCPPGVNGIVSVTGSTSGVLIDGPSAVGVILRGLVLEGGGQGQSGSGIEAKTAVNLVVEDCSIRAFHYAVYQGTPGSATSLNNSVLLGCAYGFYLYIASGPGVSASINHCRVELNGLRGVYSRGETSSSVTTTITDSVIYRNAEGIIATRTGGTAASSTVLVSDSVITANGTGVAGNGSPGAGLILSRGNNTLVANAAGNDFPGTYPAK